MKKRNAVTVMLWRSTESWVSLVSSNLMAAAKITSAFLCYGDKPDGYSNVTKLFESRGKRD
jgi:hypothetical protein